MWRLAGWLTLGLALALCPIALLVIDVVYQRDLPDHFPLSPRDLAKVLLLFHIYLSIVASFLSFALVRRWRRCVASWLGIVVLLAAVGLLSDRLFVPPPLLQLDDPTRIAQIEAVMETRELDQTFFIEPDDFPKVLRLFRDGVIERGTTLPWVCYGALRITYKDGRLCAVVLFQTGGPVGAYRFNEVVYRGTTDKEILDTMLECYTHSKGVRKQ